MAVASNGNAVEGLAPRSLLGVLWDDAPLLNYAWYAVAIAHAEIANLQTARFDLLPTLAFPLLVPIAVYGLRFSTACRRERAVGIGVCLGAPALIAASYLVGVRSPLDPDLLRDFYEAGAILNTVILMLHAAGRDRKLVAFFLGPAALYGLLLENGGIFLGFFAELKYRIFLGPLPAPLATMSGWVTVFYLVMWVTWEARRYVVALRSSPIASAFVATLAGLALDLQIDPIATDLGLWRWNAGLTPGFYGVPILNFVAWACAIFPFAWVMFQRESAFGLGRGEIATAIHRAWAWGQLLPVLVLASVLFLAVMAAFEGSFTGPTYGILYEAAARLRLFSPDLIWLPGS